MARYTVDDIRNGVLDEVFSSGGDVGVVYLFGSQVTGDIGPLSDFDFGVYLTKGDHLQMGYRQIELIPALMSALQTDAVDVVILNLCEQPELKFHIIAEGEVIYEIEPHRLLIEPPIMNEYYDFKLMLQRNGLTHT